MEKLGTILDALSNATCVMTVWPCVHTLPQRWHLPPEPLQSCLSISAVLRTSAEKLQPGPHLLLQEVVPSWPPHKSSMGLKALL